MTAFEIDKNVNQTTSGHSFPNNNGWTAHTVVKATLGANATKIICATLDTDNNFTKIATTGDAYLYAQGKNCSCTR